jgi:hypothetical protein
LPLTLPRTWLFGAKTPWISFKARPQVRPSEIDQDLMLHACRMRMEKAVPVLISVIRASVSGGRGKCLLLECCIFVMDHMITSAVSAHL